MTYKGHLATGFVIATPVFAYLKPDFNITDFFLFLATTSIFSVFPDIDTPKSFISNRNTFLKLISFILSLFVKHRGITHSIMFVMFVTIGLYYLTLTVVPSYYWLSMIAGAAYFSHLFADALTKEGIAFFYPFSSKRFRMLPEVLAFRTGSVAEYFITLIFSMLAYLEFVHFNILKFI